MFPDPSIPAPSDWGGPLRCWTEPSNFASTLLAKYEARHRTSRFAYEITERSGLPYLALSAQTEPTAGKTHMNLLTLTYPDSLQSELRFWHYAWRILLTLTYPDSLQSELRFWHYAWRMDLTLTMKHTLAHSLATCAAWADHKP